MIYHPMMRFYTNTHPIMNFILPARAVLMTVGNIWGSRGPNIPWGLTATVSILPLSLNSSTNCSRGKSHLKLHDWQKERFVDCIYPHVNYLFVKYLCLGIVVHGTCCIRQILCSILDVSSLVDHTGTAGQHQPPHTCLETRLQECLRPSYIHSMEQLSVQCGREKQRAIRYVLQLSAIL